MPWFLAKDINTIEPRYLKMIFNNPSLITGDIPALDRTNLSETKTATFSMGCFWGPDALFGALPGVVRTRVGYAGGKESSPTYRNLGGHTETIQLDYYPEVIGYVELLDTFLNNHDVTSNMSTQYRSMIFYHHEEQASLAFKTKEEDPSMATIIRRYSLFHLAEDYHQKYHLSTNRSLYKAFRSIYPEMKDFVYSTAVARANGYVSGYGEISSEGELEALGLNETGGRLIYEIWRRASPACSP